MLPVFSNRDAAVLAAAVLPSQRALSAASHARRPREQKRERLGLPRAHTYPHSLQPRLKLSLVESGPNVSTCAGMQIRAAPCPHVGSGIGIEIPRNM
eukprot:2449183-Rhodomonas_salina.8